MQIQVAVTRRLKTRRKRGRLLLAINQASSGFAGVMLVTCRDGEQLTFDSWIPLSRCPCASLNALASQSGCANRYNRCWLVVYSALPSRTRQDGTNGRYWLATVFPVLDTGRAQ